MSIPSSATPDATTAPPSPETFVPVSLQREDEGGICFLTSVDIPELFVALRDEADIHTALDKALTGAFGGLGRDIQVFTPCDAMGPAFEAVVKLTPSRHANAC